MKEISQGTTARAVGSSSADRATRALALAQKRWWLSDDRLLWVLLLLLLACGLAMRLYQLGQPFERDFDEGVYWSSLRAMGQGAALYRAIFYSQPPFFLQSLYPLFLGLGQTLWAARLGVTLISLVGLLGAWLLGQAVAGRWGALIALLLTLTSVPFLNESRILQADGPSTALSLLAVGLAFQWWRQPAGGRGLLLAVLSGVTLVLSILTKFLVIASVIPVATLVLMRLWQARHQLQGQTRSGVLLPLLAGVLAGLLVALLCCLPYLGSYEALIAGMIGLHVKAAALFRHTLRTITLPLLRQGFSTPLTLAALAGVFMAILRRDIQLLPLLLWLLGTVAVLMQQAPLFAHHLVALVAPLVGLGVLARPDLQLFVKQVHNWGEDRGRALLALIMPVVAVVLCLVISLQAFQSLSYLEQPVAAMPPPLVQRVATDLKELTAAGTEVISDDPFITALANRRTPPWLVDTSSVRIQSGYLTLSQLIKATEAPQVQAVLFVSGRFYLPSVAGYHAWVAQRFHLVRVYGVDASGHPQELWIR
jgi:4-amino-4-deoxy-L-arabinose transferase-like glycosyltransferase